MILEQNCDPLLGLNNTMFLIFIVFPNIPMHNKQNARKNKQEGKTHAKSLAWHFKICRGMEMKDQGNKKGKERWGVPTFPTSSGSTFPTIFNSLT